MGNKLVSLFSGCGGLDLGFQMAGFEIVWASDKDPDACKTHHLNFGSVVSCVDLTSISGKDVPDADVIVLGPPCQGFSNIGKRNPNDERNQLIKDALRIIRDKAADFVLVENVKGFKSFMGGSVLEELISGLRALNYKTNWKILNAKDFGIPQNRERIFILASKLKIDSFFESVDALASSNPAKLGDAVADIERTGALPNHFAAGRCNTRYKSIISNIAQGQKLCNSRLGVRSVHTWEIPSFFGPTTKHERNLLSLSRLRRKWTFMPHELKSCREARRRLFSHKLASFLTVSVCGHLQASGHVL